jgi:N-methylhydantoinase B
LNTEDGVGHGRFRGGVGIIKDYRILNSSAEFTTDVNRSKVVPWGIDGGNEGTSNYMVILRGGKEIYRVRKISLFKLVRDYVVSIRTGAGGGWGDPRARDPSRVAMDVRDGLVSEGVAKEVYGVAVDARNWTVDGKATSVLRKH